MVGVSYNTVAYWARRGLLKSQKEWRTLSNGTLREVMVFDRDAVLKLAGQRSKNEAMNVDPEEVAARAFEMFDEGATIGEVVVKLRRGPERIELLHEQWLSCGGAEFVLNPAARRDLSHVIGPFDGVADLVQRVTEMGKQLAELTSRLAAAEASQPRG